MASSSAPGTRACSHKISPSSEVGKILKLTQESYLGLTPVSDYDSSLMAPFPLASYRELLLHRDHYEFRSNRKTFVFLKYKGWRRLVEKFAPRYEEFWRAMKIYDFITLTCHEIKVSENMLDAALSFWSPNCNSLILPLGPMSITLRDVMALTGLPTSILEIPSRIQTDAFSHMRVLKSNEIRSYSHMINCLLSLDEVTDDEHVDFLWLLLCQFVFEPIGGKPTSDVFTLAKALASGTPLALGSMLLANTFERLSLTISDEPLSKVHGGIWLFQLWLFAYFPHLATEQIDITRGSIGVDLCYSYSDMEFGEAVRRFRELVPGSINLFLFDSPGSFLPTWAANYFAATDQSEMREWENFTETRHLYHGISKSRNPKSLSRGMVLYAPCLWARQLGFYQAIPGPLPFLTYKQQHDALDEDMERSEQIRRQATGPII